MRGDRVGSLEGLELFPVRLPMRHRFRRVDHRDIVLLHGPAGWGEFSPFGEYPLPVAARWLAAGLEAACVGFPPDVRHRIPVNVTVPAVDPETAAALTSQSGCRTAKVKVAEPGQTESDDLARLEAVRDTLGADGKLRVDVNAAWDVDTARRRIREMARFDLEYVEQPVASLDDMRSLRKQVEVPIAADELVRHLPDPRQVVDEEAADVVVVKVQPLGGVARVLDVAERVAVPVVVSSAIESSVGIAAGLAAAAALPELPFACGLATVSLLGADVVAAPLTPVDGEIAVSRPEPDPAAVEANRPSKPVAAEMLARIHAAGELLA